MGKPVPEAVVKVPLLRQHTDHPARLDGRQFLFLNRGLHAFIDFIFRFSSQYQFCPHENDRQHRSSGRGIEAIRTATLGVPKPWTLEPVHPCALYAADKAVLAARLRVRPVTRINLSTGRNTADVRLHTNSQITTGKLLVCRGDLSSPNGRVRIAFERWKRVAGDANLQEKPQVAGRTLGRSLSGLVRPEE